MQRYRRELPEVVLERLARVQGGVALRYVEVHGVDAPPACLPRNAGSSCCEC
ncbi:hypothetical protein PC116_g7020 [Phytophthora cactorum]|uniref:Uncharacterized protein n=1 Tax=Phytophthora cactorum TaxID=29920 RepID=A0A8T1LCB9_9STRA|nr:hypothetical protein PC114_g19527 [Phytophthora cactorum]KAG2912326.1 hypothetical protein PC117_g18939 [Phytophthora cactorum]KAG2991670.1 hypothetical protein PC119_g18825 [Phytophthora cactorum]KAG3004947.1 hypothetical protein PC120_g18277 [Phytophthora cactorum]KAG3141151.1 hypothetical protein C6341_g19849 [Phytophthora cactorum]